MTSAYFERAQDYMWRNARLIDRHLFAYLFREGPKEPVIIALKAYQNPDRGFGSALEPDKRAPGSQPIDAEMALKYLNMLDELTDPRLQSEILLPLCDWLQAITTAEGGIPISLQTANAYPHAPWWEAPDNLPAALNPTASITGFLLKSGLQHPWIKRAEAFCWHMIETSQDTVFHTLIPELVFLEHAADRPRAEKLLAQLAERVRQPGVVELNPDAGGYVQMPLDWASLPTSPLRPIFDDATLQAHLHALLRRQRPDGGWPISWDALSPAVECEWRGYVTIGALMTLRSYESAGYPVG